MNSEQKADRGLRLPRGIWLLFFGSLLLRYAFADYPHAVVIYPDELLYRTFAETIAAGRGLVLYNQPFDFQKILYSVVLAPAFLVRGRQLQFHLIALINAAVMSSAIFPFCWIAQRLLGDRRLTLLIGGFGCLLPDLCYSATYMSEVLFLPLSGWLLCGFCLLLDAPSAGAKRPLLAALLGAGSYLVNINKEVALLFPAAWILYAVGDLLLSAPQERREKLGESLLCIAAMLLGLGGLRLLFNAVFFRGMGSYYDLLSLDGLFSPGGPKYLIYAFFYCLMNVTLSAGLFPLAIPALFYREMKPRQRRFFLFLLLLVLVFSAIIAFTLSLQEDYQITPIPRAHMRYFCFLWLPCLMLLFAPVPAQGAPRREQLMLLVLFALGGLMFLRWYGGAYDDSTVDNTVLKWAGRLPFDHVWLRLLCVLLAAAGLVLFYKRRRLFLPLFLLLFCTADMLWTFTAPLIGRNAVSEYAFRAALAAALTAAALAAGKRGGPRIAAGVFAQIPPAVVGVMLLFELACYYRDYGVSEAWYNAMYAVSACLMLFSVLWFAYRALRLTAARDELLGRMSELLAGGTELAGTDESLRRFRHDFKNHTIVLEALLTEGDIEGARRYVSALTGAAAAGMPAFVTGNAAVNALLSAKAAATAPDGIRIVFRGRIPAEGIDPTRLCVIAGNLLDNAAEACRLLPEGTDRLIGVSAAAEGQSLLFSVRNPTAGQIKRAADGSPATTKGNRRLHGFGLRNVRDAAKSLGGSLTLETENGTFTANVLIPIGG